MSKREANNIDWLRGVHYPLQTYGWSGHQLGASPALAIGGKKPTDAAPMIITSQPPGIWADGDKSWRTAFGASHDCVLGLFSGKKFKSDSIDNIEVTSVYRDSMGTADLHLYELVNNIQQIDFIVGCDTVTEALNATTTNIINTQDARGLSMRIPMMAIGWGRTVGMHPTDPSPSDVNNRLNDDSHKLSRGTWKLGPVDLRWDKRRGVWGAWNDLIVDDRGQNLGTMMFSTNPDAFCGFPFLRGKLEDVFRVRRTPRQEGILLDQAQLDEFAKTAEIVTTLNHQWFDPVRNTVDLMSNVFLIDTLDGAPSETCGSEITSTGRLEILTTTFFHFSETFHGPIQFSIAPIQDDELIGEMKFDGAAWLPVVTFDVCQRIGPELNILYDNDVELNNGITELAARLNNIVIDTQVMCTTNVVVDGTSDSAPLAQAAQQAIEGTAQNAVTTIDDAFVQLVDQLNLIFAQLISEIVSCLGELGKDCPITPVTAEPPNIQGIETVPVDAPALILDANAAATTTCDATSSVEAPEDPFEDPALTNPCP